jgi:hypothetical protein
MLRVRGIGRRAGCVQEVVGGGGGGMLDLSVRMHESRVGRHGHTIAEWRLSVLLLLLLLLAGVAIRGGRVKGRLLRGGGGRGGGRRPLVAAALHWQWIT